MKKKEIIQNMIDYSISTPERMIAIKWCLLAIASACVFASVGLEQIYKLKEKEK